MKMTFIKQVFANQNSKANQPIRVTKLLRVITAISNQLRRMATAPSAHAQILATSGLKSAIAMFLAISLVACAGGVFDNGIDNEVAGGGGGKTNDIIVTPFSHNAYVFAPAINGSKEITAAGESVGRVFANPVLISELVAEQLDNVTANDILTGDATAYYNLSFYFTDDDVSSVTNTYFNIDEDTGEINISNPSGAGLSFDDIRGLLVKNSTNVGIEITLTNGEEFVPIAADNDAMAMDVDVEILNLAARIAAGLDGSKAFLSYDVAGITAGAASGAASSPANASFINSGILDENNDIAAEVNFALPNNPSDPAATTAQPISAFAIGYANASAPQITLFYALVDNTNTTALDGTSPSCGNGAIYLDNNDMTLKAGRQFNFEVRNAYSCRLAVSTDGISYRPLSFIVGSNINVSDNSPAVISNTTNAINNNVYLVSQVSNQTTTCTTGQCYYGDISISIADVNERPTITLSNNGVAFAPVAEGLGPDSLYKDVAGPPISGALARGMLINSVNLSIADEDNNQTGVNPADVALSISPNHRVAGAFVEDAFTINPATAASRTNYQLSINASMLDHEAFTPAQLTADGRAIYNITITTKDDRDDDLPSEETFRLEVTDVLYNPVFVNPTGNPIAPIGTSQSENRGADAFARSDNLLTAEDGSLLLLSDIRAFYRNIIGAYAAVDPETKQDEGLIYSIVNNDPITALERNIALTSTAAERGRRLIVTGTNLRDGNTATLTLRVANTLASVDASVSTNISLQVDNAAYQDTLRDEFAELSALPSVLFNSSVPLIGDFEEGPYDSNEDELVSFGREIPVAIPAFSEFSTAAGVIINDSNSAPGFGLMDAAAFNSLPSILSANLVAALGESGIAALIADTDIFTINANTGELSINPAAEVSFPTIYRFAIFVTPTEAASTPNFVAGTSDIAIIEVVVADDNTPPVATNLAGAILDGTNILTASIPESNNVGVELVSFNVTDDNLLLPNGTPEVKFVGNNEQSVADLLDIQTSLSGEVLTATLVSKVKLDFETARHRETLANLRIRVTDAGEYTSISAGEVVRGANSTSAIPDTSKSIAFSSNITLVDVPNEAAQLMAAVAPLAIKESAAQGTSPLQVATLINPADFPNADGAGFNSTRIDLTLTGSFAGILQPVFGSVDAATNSVPIALRVENATGLENLGDGRIFKATIIAQAADAAAANVSVNVRIEDDPANSQIRRAVITEALSDLNISEQAVAGMDGTSYSFPNFSIHRHDLVADADEFLFEEIFGRTRPLVNRLALDISAIEFEGNLNPRLEDLSILSADEDDAGVFTLQLSDGAFVEDALFGDISFMLRPRSGGATGDNLDPLPAKITVNPASPKLITYNDNNPTPVPARPPVYALSYTQSEYAAEVGQGALVQANMTTLAGAIGFDNFDNTISGVATTYINITDEDGAPTAYTTVAITADEVDGTNNRFISRTDAASNGFAFSGNAQRDNNDRSIIINLNDVELTTAANLDILVVDDANKNLVDGRAEFDRYFNLTLDNTAGARRLIINQKTFEYTDDKGTPDPADDTLAYYNALDTLQLYAGAKQSDTLNYFIRAKTAEAPADNSDASHYALAQFSVEVETQGLNQPTEVVRLALVPSDEGFDYAGPQPVFHFNASASALQLDANELAVNSFDEYDLLVEFRNPDAITNDEGLPNIAVAVAEGEGPVGNELSNLASDSFLLDLRPNEPGGSGRLPSASAVNLAGTATAATMNPDGVSANYTERYNFALAQNLHGQAVIRITVTDRDTTGKLIGAAVEESFTLVVNPPTPSAPVLAVAVMNGTDTLALDELMEDVAPLTSTGANIDVGLEYTISNLSTPGSAPGTIRGISDERVTELDLDAPVRRDNDIRQNPLNKEFFTKVDTNTIRYTEHGWGVQELSFTYTIQEPRGFGLDLVTRSFTAKELLVVAPTADPTLVVNGAGLPGFLARDFAPANTLVTPVVRNDNILVSFSDDDLLFDTLTNVLGEQVIASSEALANLPDAASAANGLALKFSAANIDTGTYNLALSGGAQAGSTDTAQIIIDSYSLTLDQAELDALLSQNTLSFDLGFAFSPAATATLVTAPFNLDNQASVIFTSNAATASIPANAVADTSLSEDDPAEIIVGNFSVSDGDITSRLASGISIAGLFAVSFAGGVEDFLTERVEIPDGTTNQANIIFETSRLISDKDVNSYTVTFTLTDNQGADASATPLPSQSFELTINRTEDVPGFATIRFDDNGARGININNPTKSFDLAVEIGDDDFLEEGPVQTLNDINYDYVEFNFSRPATSNEEFACRVAGSNTDLLSPTNLAAVSYARDTVGRASLSGGLRNATGGLLTLVDIIKSTTHANCAEPQIGDRITAAMFGGVNVSSPNEATPIVVEVDFGNPYTIQGYKQATPTGAVSRSEVNISAGGEIMTLTLQVTDGDTDDGTPLNPSPTSAIRDDGTGAAWASTPVVTVNSAGCSGGSLNVVASTYTAVTGRADQANSTISISAPAGVRGSCSATITAGEDGQMISPQVILITIEEPPVVTLTLVEDDDYFLPENFTYNANFSIIATITDGDADENVKDVTLESINPAICKIASGGNPPSFPGASRDLRLSITPIIPGACRIRVNATEDNALTSITENYILPQLPPRVVANGRNFYGVGAIPIQTLVTKRDPAPATSLTHNSRVVSGGCAVSVTSPTDYATADIGATASASYSVTTNSPNNKDKCLIIFTATDAAGQVGETQPISVKIFPLDEDGDGENFAEDIDDDGNGLIDIYTAAELDLVRHNLAGTGLYINSTNGTSRGCGGSQDADGNDILACVGYELMQNIDLLDLDIAEPENGNWVPIGTNSTTEADAFTGIFDGNDYSISNLNINAASLSGAKGIGFFGALSGDLSNLHLANVTIVASKKTGVGSIVGILKENSRVHHSSAQVISIRGNVGVGGLIGIADDNVVIENVKVEVQRLVIRSQGGNAGDALGGILGQLTSHSRVINASASTGIIDGESAIGGLIGKIYNHNVIKSSLAKTGLIKVTGQTFGAAGLVGNAGTSSGSSMASGNQISFSVAIVDSFSSNLDTAGFIGEMDNGHSIIGGLAIVRLLGSSASTAGLTTRMGSGSSIRASMATVYSAMGVAIGAASSDASGSFIGELTRGNRIDFSLALNRRAGRANSNLPNNFVPAAVGPFVGGTRNGVDSTSIVNSSYWDANITYFGTGRYDNGTVFEHGPNPDVNYGANYSRSELEGQTEFSGIYEYWGGLHTGWCNPTNADYSPPGPRPSDDYLPLWDLGTADEYPALNCLPISVAEQRRLNNRALNNLNPLQ